MYNGSGALFGHFRIILDRLDTVFLVNFWIDINCFTCTSIGLRLWTKPKLTNLKSLKVVVLTTHDIYILDQSLHVCGWRRDRKQYT